MPNEYNKILKYIHVEKSLKATAIIYAVEKMHSCHNNTKKKISLIVTKVKAVWKGFVKT